MTEDNTSDQTGSGRNSTKKLLGLLLVLVLLFSQHDLALARKHTPPARRYQTLISNVSATSLPIVEDSGPKTFIVKPFTEVLLNDQKATIDQLKKGMRVSVVLEDPTKVRQIKAWSTE